MPARQRIAWIDTAKALGMVLVVLGHVLPVEEGTPSRAIVEGIFLFHMPLFFVLSGLLFSPGDTRSIAARRSKSLLIPYAGYLVTILCLDTIISLIAGHAPSVTTPRQIADLVLGGSFATGKYGVIWFLTCLFLVTLAFNEIAMRLRNRQAPVYATILVALGLSAVLSTMQALPNPWGIFSVPAGVIAFYFGYKLRSLDIDSPPVRLFVFATVLVAIGAYMFTSADFRFDMKHHLFGPPILGIALALSLSTIFMWGCRLLDGRMALPYLARIGGYLLPIMMLHQLVHFTLTDFGVGSLWVIAVLSFGLPLAAGLAFERWTLTRKLFLGRDDRI
jgi:fucose 4-O-acetylase-like acetyltransferase